MKILMYEHMKLQSLDCHNFIVYELVKLWSSYVSK